MFIIVTVAGSEQMVDGILRTYVYLHSASSAMLYFDKWLTCSSVTDQGAQADYMH